MVSVEEAFDTVLSGETLRIVQFPHPWLKIFAQNDNGHAALLIKSDLPREVVVGDARGFSIKTSRQSGDQYIRFVSDQAGCPPIFAKLADHLIETTAPSGSEAESIVRLSEAVSNLKRFFSRRPGRLTHDQAQGLFSEIQVLSRLVRSGLKVDQAASAWKGPFSRSGTGLHDFTFPNGAGIEVKSSNQPATEVRVSSTNQLVPGDVGLDLVVVPIETTVQNVNGSLSLRDAVAVLRALVADSPDASETIHNALEEFGVNFEDEYYEQWRFMPGIWKVYQVESGFPFVDVEHIPRGIIRVSYSLSLADLQNFEVEVDSFLDRVVATNG